VLTSKGSAGLPPRLHRDHRGRRLLRAAAALGDRAGAGLGGELRHRLGRHAEERRSPGGRTARHIRPRSGWPTRRPSPVWPAAATRCSAVVSGP